MSTTRTIYFTNNSGIELHANGFRGDNITVTQSVIPSSASDLAIATWTTRDGPEDADWGWIDLYRGASDTDPVYQIYFEHKQQTINWCFIGHYDSSRSESTSNPTRFSDGVGWASFVDGNYCYTFKGKPIEHRWQLNGAQVWQHWGTAWTDLSEHTCVLNIDQETTRVKLSIANNCGKDFWLNVTQDDKPVWPETKVPKDTIWEGEFVVSTAAGQTSEFEVKGYYDPPDPPDQPTRSPLPALYRKARDEVDDPTFKIKRSTTKCF